MKVYSMEARASYDQLEKSSFGVATCLYEALLVGSELLVQARRTLFRKCAPLLPRTSQENFYKYEADAYLYITEEELGAVESFDGKDRPLSNPLKIRYVVRRGVIVFSEYFINKDDSILIYPGDLIDGAGTKFKLGDIVSYESDGEQIVGVVGAVPGVLDKDATVFPYWENSYAIDYITNKNKFAHSHIHESEIKKFDGSVCEGLAILRGHYKGEFTLSDTQFNKLNSGDYNLLSKVPVSVFLTENGLQLK